MRNRACESGDVLRRPSSRSPRIQLLIWPVMFSLFFFRDVTTSYRTLIAACSVGEYPRCSTVRRNQAFKYTGGVSDLSELGRELEERGELGFSRGDGRRGEHCTHLSSDLSPMPRRGVTQIWTTQVWTVVSGHTVRIASGKPLTPLQQVINTLVRPRFWSSVSIVTQCFAPSPFDGPSQI